MYIALDSIKNNKHRAVIRKISDIFDNNRGNIDGHVAITVFDNHNSTHRILFNTCSPQLDGKELVKIGSNGLLLSRTEIKEILCSDPQNNKNISMLKDPNNNETWDAVSDDKKIRLMIRLVNEEEDVQGFSITFADTTKKQYKIDIMCVNKDGQIISEPSSLRSSMETNNAQFFSFQNKVEGIDRVILDIEVMNTNIYEWSLRNISIYNHLDSDALSLLASSRIISLVSVANPVLAKEFKDSTPALMAVTPENQIYTDKYGTILPFKPDTSKQFIEELPDTRTPYAITDLKGNVGKSYTYASASNNNPIIIALSPTEQINKYPDEPVVELSKLVDKGYIKYGGFKNYILTFYIKVDEVYNNINENLIWKYGGWLFNPQFPDMARATNICIPIGNPPNSNITRVYTEYIYNKWAEQRNGVKRHISRDFSSIEEGKWYGFQCIRQVIDKNHCKATVKINTAPFDEKGKLQSSIFKDLLVFDDITTGNHVANTWGSINELLSIGGAKYVSLYGLSLFEIED